MRIAPAVFALSTLVLANPALAMDGTNLDTGDTVTVDDATAFKVGSVISVFDADGNELAVTVQAINETATAWDIDVQDQDLGDTVSLEFPKK